MDLKIGVCWESETGLRPGLLRGVPLVDGIFAMGRRGHRMGTEVKEEEYMSTTTI